MRRTFEFTLDNEKKITATSPTLRMWTDFLNAKNDGEIISIIAKLIGEDTDYIYENFTIDDLTRFIGEYPQWVKGVKDKDPN